MFAPRVPEILSFEASTSRILTHATPKSNGLASFLYG